VAEGAPLLREYRVKSLIEGSNPSLSAKQTTRRKQFLRVFCVPNLAVFKACVMLKNS
jgi:hypothetical protein